jgi:3D (Asp-Asp-Asp) domain-containing protein
VTPGVAGDARGGVLAAGALAVALAAGCAAQGGNDWVHDGSSAPDLARGGQGWIKAPAGGGAGQAGDPAWGGAGARGEGDEAPVLVREHGRPGRPARPVPQGAGVEAQEPGLFRNTYYDFPREGAGARDATVYDAACAPIAAVTRAFHDQVCVQGSGRIASGATISFASRDCACADVCPRTGQRICFERLDPARFPHGRGAMGRAIAPLRTVAVDAAVIPLGTRIFVPEFVGVPRPDGTAHDGCFVAEDRGIKVVGRQIDVFAGDPAETVRLNAILASNRGVHVVQRDPRCGGP